MSVEKLTLQDWDSDTEESLSRIEEGTKFAGKVPGIDLDALTGELQGYFAMGGFDIAAFKQSGRVFAQAYGRYKEGLQKILEKFRENLKNGLSISSAKKIAIDDFRDVCSKAYSTAYQAGAMRVGNPGADELGVAGQKIANAGAKVETGFFGNRLDAALDPGMDDIITGAYGDSLRASYYNGMVGGCDNNQQFIWKLGHDVEVHCPDCMDLASAGPYSKLTLPTTPRSGDTECLWRCDCSLVPIGGVASQVGAGLKPGEENLAVSVTSLTGGSVSMGTSKLFSDLYDQVNRARVAFEFAVDEPEKKAIVAKKSILAQNIIDLADSMGVRVTPAWSVGDIKAVTSAMKAKGYVFIKDIAQISLGAKGFP